MTGDKSWAITKSELIETMRDTAAEASDDLRIAASRPNYLPALAVARLARKMAALHKAVYYPVLKEIRQRGKSN